MSTYERVRATNSVWYLFLPWIEKYLDKLPTRDYVQKLIRDYCEENGITRRSMGLVTGARASMYFDGNWHSVNHDSLDELAENGTDILFIEKADVAKVFTEFARKYGVAIVNTIGYLTEYGRDLMKAANKSGAQYYNNNQWTREHQFIFAALNRQYFYSYSTCCYHKI